MDLYKTWISVVDSKIDDTIRVAQDAVAWKIDAVYLLGSYTDRTYLPTSDIDLAFVISGWVDRSWAEQLQRIIYHRTQSIVGPELDLYIIPRDEINFQDPKDLLMREGVINMMYASRLVWWNEMRGEIWDLPIEDYRALSFETPLFFMKKVRWFQWDIPSTSEDLNIPDDLDEYNGYLKFGDTKGILTLIWWICTALVAQKSPIPIWKKSDVLTAFKEYVGGKFLDLVEEAFQLIRAELAYNLPVTENDKARLKAICKELIYFEREYLKIYGTIKQSAK